MTPSWEENSVTAFGFELAGYLFLLAGLSIRMWSGLYIGGRKSLDLVTTGPYSICRNPLYVGTFLVAIGVALCFENLLMVAAVFVIVIPAHILTADAEERNMESKFPEEYAQYRQRVRRFWPRFRNYRSDRTIVVSVNAIRRVAIDTLAFLLIPQLEDLIELLHNNGILPVLWRFP